MKGRVLSVVRPVGWFALAVAAVEVLFGRNVIHHILGVPIPVGLNYGQLLLGAIDGMLYSLLAFGLILVYRANRIINFASSGLGLVPAVLGLLLIIQLHWSYWPALIVMLVGSALSGGIIELAMRRFNRSPRLIATVATIGVAQLAVYMEIELPGWLGGTPSAAYSFPTPYSHAHFSIDGVVFTGDYLAIIVATTAICVGLAGFLRYTRSGIAIRAAAENGERAQLLGIPVARLSLIVWVIAGVTSGIAIFLQAPVTALPTGGTLSTTVLLYGLAAAVIARMESLPVALGAGMVLGMFEQGSYFSSSASDEATTLMLPLILIALLLQRRRMSRAFDTGISSFKSLQEFRPIPAELRQLPEVVAARISLAALIGVVLVAAPFVLGESRAGYLSLILIAAMISISLVVLSGWAGQISLGQWGFAGIGAGIAGGMATRLNADFFITMAAAAIAGAVVAVLIGLPALRIPGLFLSVVTLGLGGAVQYGFLSGSTFSWLLPPAGSYVNRPDLWGRFSTNSDKAFYFVILAFFVLAYAAARSLRHSRSGRVFIGLRDNVRAAQSYGVAATRARLAAFALSGAIAATAGGLSAFQSQVDPSSFSMDLGLTAFLFAVVGGLTSLPGAVIGTALFESLTFFGGQTVAVLATGVGVLIILFVLPGGLAQAGFSGRDALLRRLAAKHHIHVPSLVADSRLQPAEHAPNIIDLEAGALV